MTFGVETETNCIMSEQGEGHATVEELVEKLGSFEELENKVKRGHWIKVVLDCYGERVVQHYINPKWKFYGTSRQKAAMMRLLCP